MEPSSLKVWSGLLLPWRSLGIVFVLFCFLNVLDLSFLMYNSNQVLPS